MEANGLNKEDIDIILKSGLHDKDSKGVSKYNKSLEYLNIISKTFIVSIKILLN